MNHLVSSHYAPCHSADFSLNEFVHIRCRIIVLHQGMILFSCEYRSPPPELSAFILPKGLLVSTAISVIRILTQHLGS
ncbi:hypothetical protein JHK87_049062 [Glycine soja]|nr:hypothetical protein JHK87_049062 [Glycine soja]